MQTWVKPEVFKLIFCSFFYHSEPVRINLPFSHLVPQFNHLTTEHISMLLSSTRRKALYKHIFQKVDKDRDNQITFKVGNSTKSILIYPYPSFKICVKIQ